MGIFEIALRCLDVQGCVHELMGLRGKQVYMSALNKLLVTINSKKCYWYVALAAGSYVFEAFFFHTQF